MTEKPQPVLVVDGMSTFMSVAGQAARLTNGYEYSFFTQMTSAVKKFTPKGIIVCWEGGGYAGREDIHPEYKASRRTMNDKLRVFRDNIQTMLVHLGVDQLHADGYEADDVGAFLSNTLHSTVMVSADKDWLQLVKKGHSLYQKVKTGSGKMEKKLITIDNFAKLTGWNTPDEFILGLMAVGDKDECPGIPGIGTTYVQAYFNNLDLPETAHAKLKTFFAGSDDYIRAKALVDLRDVTDLQVTLREGKYDERAALNLLTDWQFNSILKIFPQWVGNYKEALS